MTLNPEVAAAASMTASGDGAQRIDIDCPLCGGCRRSPFIEARDPMSEHRFLLVRCDDCRLVYICPRPPDERLPVYYPDGYYGRRHRFLSDFFISLRVGALPSLPAGGRLLDIGCGYGEFLRACRHAGWDVVGVEQTTAPIMELSRSIGLEVLPTSGLADLPDASFDVVTMWHVLEHMTEPRRILAEARRLLKPGGALVVEVPNLGSWQARMGPAYWFHLDAPRHLIHFERDTLDAILRAEGFDPQSWATFSAEYDAFGVLQSLLNRVCDTHAYLFQLLIDKRSPGTRRDMIVTASGVVPIGVIATVFSIVAPIFRRGGVLRTSSRRLP